jgi:acyl-CoA thioesterase-1
LETFFPRKPYVNQASGGQTTSQMLIRMFQDVIDLRPAAVILLGGTNDIAHDTGPQTARMVEENIEAITEQAALHHVKVILCSITPVSDYTSYQQTSQRPPARILQLNAWINNYASATHAIFCDYYSALVDGNGMLKKEYSDDGLHPNDRGYRLLAPIGEDAIERALGEKP